MTKMASKTYIIAKFFMTSILLVCVGLFYCGCNTNKHCGFTLSEFHVDDGMLKNIVDSMVLMHQQSLQSETKKVLSLNLTRKDSSLVFIFSLMGKDDLVNKYIYRDNKRIVGYTNSGNTEVILLSDIDDLSEFGRLYAKFIHPTGILKEFSYIYFPEGLYVGNGQNTWPQFELIYDPTYIIYQYVNNRFLPLLITKDPSLIDGGLGEEATKTDSLLLTF